MMKKCGTWSAAKVGRQTLLSIRFALAHSEIHQPNVTITIEQNVVQF